MLSVRYVGLILLYFTAFSPAFAQISPPGLDDTKAVAWGAIGVSQQEGSKWQTTVYLGGSRESTRDNFSLFKRFAIGVVDAMQLYRFNDHWSLAGEVSYRKQGMYEGDEPEARDEMRYYMRLYYRHKINRMSFTYTLRPELRTYYNATTVPYEYRFRLKAAVSIPLNSSGSNQFVLGEEILSVAQPKFSSYVYTEDRVTTYFRRTFKEPRLIVDAGVMYQFLAGEGLITQFAFDVIFVDPFGSKK